MSRAAVFLLLCVRAGFAFAGYLNAPRGEKVLRPDGTDGGTGTIAFGGVDQRQRPLLDRTRPFAVINRRRRSLAEALQEGHPDRLQCGLEVSGRLFLLNLEKNQGVVTVNSTLTIELQPAGGGAAGADLHLVFSTSPSEDSGTRSCGLSRAAVPPIHSSSHTRRSKRDILTETKYIELVLVADHQEVSERTTAS
ncbi:unnamed protein product [Tetraodon nigroviridis]|uniref:(spotted green pufferfish) hypothetical protein n=1 Tax=Tetraodon nigroviridis TaxID=99883 RepID=Q4SW12_TETNG|nr:unnamed protein product [Tetraodon nigroviridis]